MTVSSSILLVEDNPDDVALTLRMLRRAGLRNEIAVVADGTHALQSLAAAPRPMLILLSLDLPGMSGYDLLRCIRAQPSTREVPVIVLNPEPSGRDRAEASAAGANAFAVKPIEFAKLASVLGTLGLSLALTDASARAVVSMATA